VDPIVICKGYRTVRAKSLLAVTSCKNSINRLTIKTPSIVNILRYHIKMDSREIELGGMGWIDLAQERDHGLVLV
jgi:hypothetical protein